eukprot:1142066-Prymnesium_polylepis.1
MYFYFDGEQIKTNADPGKCMQCSTDLSGDGNSDVRMVACDSSSNNQKWFWWRPGDHVTA